MTSVQSVSRKDDNTFYKSKSLLNGPSISQKYFYNRWVSLPWRSCVHLRELLHGTSSRTSSVFRYSDSQSVHDPQGLSTRKSRKNNWTHTVVYPHYDALTSYSWNALIHIWSRRCSLLGPVLHASGSMYTTLNKMKMLGLCISITGSQFERP